MALLLRSRAMRDGMTAKALTLAATVAGFGACAPFPRTEARHPVHAVSSLAAPPSSAAGRSQGASEPGTEPACRATGSQGEQRLADGCAPQSGRLHADSDDRFAAVKAPDTPAHCAWATADWRLARDIELRFRPDGPPFARTTAARSTARVVVTDGLSGPTSFVEMSSDDIRLRGYLDQTAFDLHATVPLAVGGAFAPEGRAALTLAKSSTGQVEIQVALPERVHLRRGLSARAWVACEQVGLDVTRFSTLPAFAGDDTTGVLLPNQPKLQLYDGPRGTPLVRIDQEDASDATGAIEHRATELDRVGGWSRVAVDVEDLMVVGWLRSSQLTPIYTGNLVGFGTGRRYHRAGLQPALRTLACGPEIPLLARAKPASTPPHSEAAVAPSVGEDKDLAYQAVGEIKTGVPFDVLAEGEDVSEVQLKGSQTQALGTFAVPTRAIARCREVLPKAEEPPKGGK